jgi:hypothetical protein
MLLCMYQIFYTQYYSDVVSFIYCAVCRHKPFLGEVEKYLTIEGRFMQ